MNTAWACLIAALIRLGINAAGSKKLALAGEVRKRLIIVSDTEDAKRILSLLQLTGSTTNFIGYVQPNRDDNDELKDFRLGELEQLNEIIEVYNADEVIFSAKNLSSQAIIEQMLAIRNRDVEYKIAPPESLFIIGSNSINDKGDFYFVDLNSITSPVNKRNKRIFDITSSLALIVISPFLLFVTKNFFSFLSNAFSVIVGNKTWVAPRYEKNAAKRGQFKKGVLTPVDGLKSTHHSENMIERLNAIYSREYKVLNDVQIVLKNISRLGNR